MRASIAALLLALPAAAQHPPADNPAAAPAAAAPAAAEKPAAAESRPYVDAAITFLKSFSHVNRPGEAGALAWDALRSVAAPKVSLKLAGKEFTVDAAAGKSEVQLVRFSKLSTWRDGAAVKGVLLDQAEFHAGAEQPKGKAKVSMSEKDGKWTVESIEIE